MVNKNSRLGRYRRHLRIRVKIKGTESRPRLSVFRSLNHIYAQVIVDSHGYTVVSASTLDPEIRSIVNGKAKIDKSDIVGSLIAKRAISKGITRVVFDRGGRKYHGRIQVLAEAARREGLQF